MKSGIRENRTCRLYERTEEGYAPTSSDSTSMKQSNVCREKGLAVVQREVRDTSSTLRGGAKMSTKLASLTLRTRENPKYRFTSLAHLLTEDFLRRCFLELKRGK